MPDVLVRVAVRVPTENTRTVPGRRCFDSVVTSGVRRFTGPDEPVLYAVHTDEADGYFAIDPVKGVIRTTAALDHESFESVLLDVRAYSTTSKYEAHTQVSVHTNNNNNNILITRAFRRRVRVRVRVFFAVQSRRAALGIDAPRRRRV